MTSFFRTDLTSGHHLGPGDVVLSPTGTFELTLQADGNLVQYVLDDDTTDWGTTNAKYRHAYWASGTDGLGAVRCEMQADGNLVLYGRNNNAIWATGTNGSPGAYLRVQDDGNLVLYGTNGTALASSNNYVNRH